MSLRFIRPVALAGTLVLISIAIAIGAPLLVNHGGTILTTPQVSAIYLGDYWSTPQGANDALHTDAFLQTWLAGPSVTNVLTQYGIVSATFASSEKVAGVSPAQFTDADAQALVQQEIAANRVVSGAQVIHVIYLPPGTVLTFLGSSSQTSFGGYHSSFRDSVTNQPVYYAVVVYGQGGNGIDFNGNPQDAITIMTSNVLAGAMTDPDLGDVLRGAPAQGTLGWRDDTIGDIGDIAFSLSTSATFSDVFVFQNGFAVELLWSNKDAALTDGVTIAPSTGSTTTSTGANATAASALSVSPASQSAIQGGTVTYTVSSAASVTVPLTLSVSGLPAGVTGTLAQTLLAPGESTTLTVAVSATAVDGTTTFTVTGVGATTTQSATATLIIGAGAAAAAPPAPSADFTLSITPTTQEITAGGEVITFIIDSQPTFRTDTIIKLSVGRLPRGIRAYLKPSTIAAGNRATLILLPRNDPPRGSREITIKGKSRRGSQTVTITIVIHKPR